MNKILLTSLIIGMILFGACVRKTPTNPNTLPPSPTPIEISAAQLYKEYKNNAAAADKKYLNRELTVSGVVKEIGKETSGTPYLLLTATLNDTNGVYCTFPNDYDSILAKLTKGQTVGITGIGAGFQTNVLLDSTH